MKKRFFTTTLLHPYRLSQTLNYNKLTRALTIRCAIVDSLNKRYIPVPIGKVVPVTKVTDASLENLSIVAFEYPAKGSPENHPMRHLIDKERQAANNEGGQNILNGAGSSNLEQIKQTRIESWAEQMYREFCDCSGDKFRSCTDADSSLQGLRNATKTGTLVNNITLNSSFHLYSAIINALTN